MPVVAANLDETANLDAAIKAIYSAAKKMTDECHSGDEALEDLQSAIKSLKSHRGGSYWFVTWSSFVTMLKGLFTGSSTKAKTQILAKAEKRHAELMTQIQKMEDGAQKMAGDASRLQKAVVAVGTIAKECLEKMAKVHKQAEALYTKSAPESTP